MSTASKSAASERPGWLKPRREASGASAPASPLVEVFGSLNAEPRRRRTPLPTVSLSLATIVAAVRWWFSMQGWSLAVSTAVHVVALGTLSLVAVHAMHQKPDVYLDAAYMDSGLGDGTELDLPGDSGLAELSSGPATPVEFVDLAATTSVNAMMLGAAERVGGALGGDGDGQGSGFGGDGTGGMGGKIGIPAYAVTKGSFSVWTDPKDPVPGRPYDIVIQVKLPSTVTSYRLRDLTGYVRGTDGFEKVIKFDSTQRRAVKDGSVQLRITIPGAADLVKDTIRIRSAILKEEQLIEIVF